MLPAFKEVLGLATNAFRSARGEPPIPVPEGLVVGGKRLFRGVTEGPSDWLVVIFAGTFPRPGDTAAKVWVDKATGQCRVWLDPEFRELDPKRDTE
jgi:hypothetical protein